MCLLFIIPDQWNGHAGWPAAGIGEFAQVNFDDGYSPLAQFAGYHRVSRGHHQFPWLKNQEIRWTAVDLFFGDFDQIKTFDMQQIINELVTNPWRIDHTDFLCGNAENHIQVKRPAAAAGLCPAGIEWSR